MLNGIERHNISIAVLLQRHLSLNKFNIEVGMSTDGYQRYKQGEDVAAVSHNLTSSAVRRDFHE